MTGAALAVILAVLGSWVRINGAGLTCPDWPLCHGSLVPALEGGVVLEWSHRLVALLEGLVLIGAVVTGWRVRGQIAGLAPVLLVLGGIFVAQVALGGATVELSNSPVSVMLHWGMAMALLAALTTLAVLALVAPAPGAPRAGGDVAAIALGSAAFFAFLATCLGAYVSSSGAGLSCPGFPACGDGTLLGGSALEALAMFHRLAAGAFCVAALVAAAAASRSRSRPVLGFAFAGLALVGLQVTLGALNVLWLLPDALREAHAANATLTFLAFVIAATLETLAPAAASRPSAQRTQRAPAQTASAP